MLIPEYHLGVPSPEAGYLETVGGDHRKAWALTPEPPVLAAITDAAVSEAMRQLRATGRTPACVDSWFGGLTC